MWVAGNSIPKFIKDADGNFGTNLKWFGWHNPPAGLASAAADHWVYLGGAVLLVLSLGSLLGVFVWDCIIPVGRTNSPQIPTEAVRQVVDMMQKASDWMRKFDDPVIVSKEINAQANTSMSLDMVVHRAADRDASLREALAYAAFGDWNNRQIDQFETGDSDRYSDALARFHQLAADGILRIWGIPASYQTTTVYRPIDKTHWGYAALDFLDALGGKPFTRSKVVDGLTYTDLRVNRAEFEREWPHAF